MSLYYAFYALDNGMMVPVQIFAPQVDSFATNPAFLQPGSPAPSQTEEKPNWSLQSGASTRESLQVDPSEKVKTGRSKRSGRGGNVAGRKDRDETFGWRNQNKDRNIMSNILKAFVNYLSPQAGPHKYAHQIFRRLGMESGVSTFQQFLEGHFPPSKSYISPKLLRSLLRDPSLPSDIALSLRHLLAHFLRLDFPLQLLKSTKIKRRSQLEQMKKARELFTFLFRD